MFTSKHPLKQPRLQRPQLQQPLLKHCALALLLATLPFALVACGRGGGDAKDPQAVTPSDTHPGLRPLPEVGETAPDPSENSSALPAATTSFFFSYDESGSTASRDLTFAALADGKAPQRSWGRPYEYLNAESFDHFDLTMAAPFNVSMGLYKASTGEIPVGRSVNGSVYALGINLTGPTLTHAERDNVALTLLVDISGSMTMPYSDAAHGEIYTRLDVVKEGLFRLLTQLKEGDILSLVTFERSAKTVIDRWVYQQDDNSFFNAIASLKATGSTNLDRGIDEAYSAANALFDPEKSNRVIILTDANANTGEVDPAVIAQSTVINDAEGIHFSGIGIGEGFDDRFLNELTDIGKGTYSAMITPNDAQRIFADNFMRFLSPAVKNVKFQLTYPQALNQFYSAAEDISTDAGEVSSINFSYNSEQFFLELFEGAGFLSPELEISLGISFTNAQGEDQQLTITKTLEQLRAVGEGEIKSAVTVTTLAQLVAGQVTCTEVMSSSLYEQDIRTYTFEKYKQGVKDFCLAN